MGTRTIGTVGGGRFDDPPGSGSGAFTLLVLHAAWAGVLVALVYAFGVISDETAVGLAICGGATQFLYVVPLLIIRRGAAWRRFRLGIIILASVTFLISALMAWAVWGPTQFTYAVRSGATSTHDQATPTAESVPGEAAPIPVILKR